MILYSLDLFLPLIMSYDRRSKTAGSGHYNWRKSVSPYLPSYYKILHLCLGPAIKKFGSVIWPFSRPQEMPKQVSKVMIGL